MRTENLKRLNDTRLTKANPQYLVYRYLFRDLQAAIGQYACGEVLDIGCGNKPYEAWFAGKITSYIGCDLVQSDGQRVDIICPANAIPLGNASKDTVFSTQVIEHVADHAGLLREASRILRPGGYAIISGPMYWEHHEEPYDFFRFTRYGFEHLLREAGLEVSEIMANGGKWALTGQALQNNLRSSFGSTKKRRILKGFYTLFRLKWIINAFFAWLDKADPDYSTTLNWVVVGRKPLEAAQ
jgi:SAM-dependent methyltransferase